MWKFPESVMFAGSEVEGLLPLVKMAGQKAKLDVNAHVLALGSDSTIRDEMDVRPSLSTNRGSKSPGLMGYEQTQIEHLSSSEFDLVVIDIDTVGESQSLAVVDSVAPGGVVLAIGDIRANDAGGHLFTRLIDMPGESFLEQDALQLRFQPTAEGETLGFLVPSAVKSCLERDAAQTALKRARLHLVELSVSLDKATSLVRSRDALIEQLEWKIEGQTAALSTATHRLDKVYSAYKKQTHRLELKLSEVESSLNRVEADYTRVQRSPKMQLKLLLRSLPRSISSHTRRLRRRDLSRKASQSTIPDGPAKATKGKA